MSATAARAADITAGRQSPRVPLLALLAAGMMGCGSSAAVPPETDAGGVDASLGQDAGDLDAGDASSRDGSRVVDSSADDGGIGDGGIGDADDGGALPPAILVHANQPTGIAVDSQFMYWADLGARTGGGCPQGCAAIWRANLDGSNVTLIVQDFGTLAFPEDVVLEGDYVYWDNTGSSSNGLPPIARCPKTGCPGPGEALPSAGPFTYGTGMAAGDAGLFWAGSYQNGLPSVWRVAPADAGPSGAITTGLFESGSLALDDDHVYFGNWSNGIVGAVSTDAPFVDLDAGGVQYVTLGTLPVSDGGGSSLDFDAPNLAVDGTSIYFAYGAGGVVGSLPKSGVPAGSSPTVFAWNLEGPLRVAVDATNVYWTVAGPNTNDASAADIYSQGAIMKCPKSGCGAAGPTVMATGLDQLSGFLAVDDTYVYFTVLGDGTIRRMPK